MTTRVLTIQDISCVGQCSITVALPVISAMGVETCILPSAILSTHTAGFSGYTFRDLTEDLPLIKQHWIKENQKFDCIYTGYIGSIKQLDYITDIMDTCLNEKGLIIIDPVMGDNGKLYTGFSKEFAKQMAKLCSKADVIVPNFTEATFLLDEPYIESGYDKKYVEDTLKKLAYLGAKKVVLTGVCFDNKELGVATYDSKNGEINYYFRDRIMQNFHGTGDVFASSFTGAMAKGYSLYESSKIAVDFTIEAMKATIDDKSHWYGVKFEKALSFLANRVQ